MKRKLRGIKRSAIQLDFNLYRVDVPLPGLADANLSVIDIWPEEVKETIVLVHGYAGCAETWEHQINHFARAYRVVAPDLRGHGQSDAPLTQYTMTELVDDLKAIVDTLQLPETFILAGHSFGGSVTVEFANAYPERLEKLILISTAGEYPLPKLVRWLYRVPVALLRPWWKFRPRWNAEPHVMKRMMLNNLSKWQGWSLLRNIRTPTLIITGERDTYFPRYVFEDLSKMVPDAEVVDVGSAKHKVQLERHEAVNRAIRRFIEGDERKVLWRDSVDDRSELYAKRPWLASYSKSTPPTIPVPRQPLFKFLESAANWVPKQTAVVFFGTQWSYRQLNRQANQFAHVLHGLGIRTGDRVMLVLPNVPQMVVAYFGALKIGAVVVLSNTEADEAEVIRQIEQTTASVVVTLRDFGKLIHAVQSRTTVEKIILVDIQGMLPDGFHRQLLSQSFFDQNDGDPAVTNAACLLMSESMADAAADAPSVEVACEELAVIIYTSGATGEPKGVCLSHANLVANTLQTRHWIQDLEYGKETVLAVAPLTHSYGMTNGMNIPIALASTIVLLPVFDVEQVLNSIRTHRPTILPGVPSMYMALNQASNVRDYGLRSVKACISGSAPLPVEVQEAFEKLTRGRLVEGYGLTEASPVTHANPLYGVRKVGSIGVPIPNTDAKIVDLLTGQELPPGEIGELLVKGPQVMQGYWNDPEKTAAVLNDGWLRTGDIAMMDGNGYFRVISRKQEVITTGGHRVYPRDVEEVIYEHNKVQDVVVVGLPMSSDDQQIKAYVVPRPDAQLSKDELLQFCRRRLEPHTVPAEIEFREALPKSVTGKVLRRVLVGDAAAGRRV